ncbi:MAG: hypothetical protein HKP17_00875 [Ignavibacteriaceae bacterium]|nr:hypothetical protein [Ignavibacteriaceae bacterium]
MDHLHKAGIEIVSPNFMNQRQVNEIKFIPKITKETKPVGDEKLPEDIIFDKAIKADKIDDKVESLQKIDEEIKGLKSASKDAEDKEEIKNRIKMLEEQKEKINSIIADDKKKLDEEK